MKKIVLFGTGKNGKTFIERNEDLLQGSFCFCDNDSAKQGRDICGLPVLSFNELGGLYAKGEIGRIIITIAKVDEVLEQCIRSGISMQYLYYYDVSTNGIKAASEIHSSVIHSQDGEEVFLKEFFARKKEGVYVDVGAYQPFRFSNTYWAYEQGWRGINIEPNVVGYEKFLWARPQDVNLNCGIAETEEEISYYEFEEGALNTFDRREIVDITKIKKIRKIPTRRLDSIFKEYCIGKIDFLDIDVEGYELSVLNSNNWGLYRPSVVLIEQKMNVEDAINSEIYFYMKKRGYEAISKYHRTMIYHDIKESNCEKSTVYSI